MTKAKMIQIEIFQNYYKSDEGTSSKIITAYFPSLDKWNSDLKTRKEN